MGWCGQGFDSWIVVASHPSRLVSPGLRVISVDRGRQQSEVDALVPCSWKNESCRLGEFDRGQHHMVVNFGRRGEGGGEKERSAVQRIQMPVPGKAPVLERTTMPRSREM